MKKNNVKPGMIVFTCLIQTCIRTKNIEKAIEVFDNLRKEKLYLDHVIYASIIMGCLYNKKIEYAKNFLLESIDNNIKLPDYIYKKFFFKVLSKYTNIKSNIKFELIEKVFIKIKEKGSNILDDETLKKITTFICYFKQEKENSLFSKRH